MNCCNESYTWCLKPSGTFEHAKSTHTYIDHIKYTDESPEQFFGTMRSADTANPGNSLFVWQVFATVGDDTLDTSNFNVKRLSIGSEVYTTGVADSLHNNKIHFVVFKYPDLYFIKGNLAEVCATSFVMIKIAEGLSGVGSTFWPPTFQTFHLGLLSRNVSLSWTVGWTNSITSDLGYTYSDSLFIGVMLPSIELTPSCIDQTNDEFAYTCTEMSATCEEAIGFENCSGAECDDASFDTPDNYSLDFDAYNIVYWNIDPN